VNTVKFLLHGGRTDSKVFFMCTALMTSAALEFPTVLLHFNYVKYSGFTIEITVRYHNIKGNTVQLHKRNIIPVLTTLVAAGVNIYATFADSDGLGPQYAINEYEFLEGNAFFLS
jgi:hypothetical protein